MSKNDDAIKVLLEKVLKARTELKQKPKSVLQTNGLFVGDGETININTVFDKKTLIDIFAFISSKSHARKEAAKALGFEGSDEYNNYPLDAWITDLKLRADIILWTEKKNKLEAMEKKLQSLMSEDARTESELNKLSKDLVEFCV